MDVKQLEQQKWPFTERRVRGPKPQLINRTCCISPVRSASKVSRPDVLSRRYQANALVESHLPIKDRAGNDKRCSRQFCSRCVQTRQIAFPALAGCGNAHRPVVVNRRDLGFSKAFKRFPQYGLLQSPQYRRQIIHPKVAPPYTARDRMLVTAGSVSSSKCPASAFDSGIHRLAYTRIGRYGIGVGSQLNRSWTIFPSTIQRIRSGRQSMAYL